MLASFALLSSRILWRSVARRVSVSSWRRVVEIDSEKDFQTKVLQSDIPVIVDFYATWCRPCQALTPLLEEVVSEQGGKLELAKVNVDSLPDLALQYQVSAVPAVMAVRAGKVVGRFVGHKDTHFLEEFARDLTNPEPVEDS